MRGRILDDAIIDELVVVSEEETVLGCLTLLSKHKIFAGGSTGSVYSAVKSYFKDKNLKEKPNVFFLACDRGDRYSQTVYDSKWVKDKFDLVI